jgi:hypothetical protein
VENGRYDFQIITFQDLKNAPVIAEIATLGVTRRGFEILQESTGNLDGPNRIAHLVARIAAINFGSFTIS